MREQLKQLLQLLSLSQKEFAESLGLKSAFISDLIHGRAKSFSQESLTKMHEKYGVNVNWLLTGSGDALAAKSQHSSLNLINQGENRSSDPEVQKVLDQLVRVLEKRALLKTEFKPQIHYESKPQEYPHGELREILDLGSIAAGILTEEVAKQGKKILFPRAWIPQKEKLFLLTVRGDSMEGLDIRAGDKAIFRECHDPILLKNGSVVAALVDNENTLKQLIRENGKIILRAANSKYHDITMTGDNHMLIQGEMIYLLKDWSNRE